MVGTRDVFNFFFFCRARANALWYTIIILLLSVDPIVLVLDLFSDVRRQLLS